MIVTRRRTHAPAQETRVVRRIPDWEASGVAGLFGGLAFLALEMTLTALSGGGFMDAPRLVASVVFGGTLAAAPSQAAVLAISLFVHFTLSLVYARVLALFLTFKRGVPAALVGAAFGLALYLVNVHGIAALVPRLAAAQGWVWLTAHVGFGVITALAYRSLERVRYE